jgi:putative phage-type endonuclease
LADAPDPELGNAGTPEERRTGLGGSDAPIALGISPWRSPLDLWEEKTGRAPPNEQNEPMLWGHLLEDVIRREYARRTGFEVTYRKEMIRHPARPWQFVHLDGEVGQDGKRILEVKSTRTGLGWGEPETAEVPQHYLAQVHHAMTVTGAEIVDIAVLIGGQDFRIYRVERDIEIEQFLIEREAQFWEHVTRDEPPGPSNMRDAMRRWGHFDAQGYVVAGDAEIACVRTLRDIHRRQKELEEMEEGAKTALMQVLGANGASLVHPDGELLCTWKLDNGRKAFSVAAKPPARRFVVKYTEAADAGV